MLIVEAGMGIMAYKDGDTASEDDEREYWKRSID